MNIFHASDLHYCSKHLAVVDRAFTHAVDYAIRNEADCAVIAGDSFDATMGIHEPAVTAYLKQIKRLADHMPVLVLQGTFSHDRPGSLDLLRTLGGEFPVYVADKAEQLFLSVNEFYTAETLEHRPVEAVFSCLPSLNKADPVIAEHGAGQYVSRLMQKWAITNKSLRDHGIPTILVSHGTVNGCVTESNHAMISPDHEFTTETLGSCGAIATMLGHIHKHQHWWNDGAVIAYPGSIARLIYGHNDPVGFLMWEIAGDKVDFAFIETPSPRLVEITYEGKPDIDELRQISTTCDENDRVRLRYSLDQEHAHSVDKDEIRGIFAHAGELKIEATINPVQSVRAAGIGRVMTLDEKLHYWAKTTGDHDRVDLLTERLHLLRSMDTDAIYKSLTRKSETEITANAELAA